MDSCELILYATPTGELAATCDRYFADAVRLGPTVAQTYPPHCTLTGFFRRSPERRDHYRRVVGELIAAVGDPPDTEVQVVGLVDHDDWIGYELDAPWLIEFTQTVIDRLDVLVGEDHLRLKDWMHVSLAYGVDDLAPYRRLAATLPTRPSAGWRLGLWERSESQWKQLAGQ